MTPKADWRSVLPERRGDGAMQLLSALAGSIATSNSTYRTPAQRQTETLGADATPAPPDPKPAAVPAGPSGNRVRAVPSPIPTPPVPTGRGPPVINTRQAARGVNGVHHPNVGRGAYLPEAGDTPVTLPKKHARPVITADAITRLARGLMVAPPKRDQDGKGIPNVSEIKASDSKEVKADA